jgi:hypothetical protein
MPRLLNGPSIPDLVSDNRSRGGSRLAVRSSTEQVTYGQLVRRFRALVATACAPVPAQLSGPELITATLARLVRGDVDDPARWTDARAATPPAARSAWWLPALGHAQQCYPLDDRDVVLHSTGPDAPEFGFETLWPLCVGATVASVAEPTPLSRLLSAQRHRVTVMALSTAALAELLAEQTAQGLVAPAHLRLIIVVGAPVPAAPLGRFATHMANRGVALGTITRLSTPDRPALAGMAARTGRLSSAG